MKIIMKPFLSELDRYNHCVSNVGAMYTPDAPETGHSILWGVTYNVDKVFNEIKIMTKDTIKEAV